MNELYKTLENIASQIAPVKKDVNLLQRGKIIETLQYNYCSYNALYAIQIILTWLVVVQHQRPFDPKNKLSGYDVYTAGIKWLGDSFIIKVEYGDQILDEVRLGLVLNDLRISIPNFMYTFLGSKVDKKFMYVSEKIEGSTLYNMLKHALLSESDLASIYLQVFFALSTAKEKFQFIHNDLHYENIIVRTLRFPIVLTYKHNQQTYYMVTKYIATIIDYGFSRIEHQGETIGTDQNPVYNILHDHNNNLIDIFKLLSSSNYIRGNHYNDLFHELTGYFKHKFHDKSNYDRLLGRHHNRNLYYPSNIEYKYLHTTPAEYLDYLLSRPGFKSIVTTQPPKGYVRCNQDYPDYVEYLKYFTTTDTPNAPRVCQDFNWPLNLNTFNKSATGLTIPIGECIKKTTSQVELPKNFSLYAVSQSDKPNINTDTEFYTDYTQARNKAGPFNVQAYAVLQPIILPTYGVSTVGTFNQTTGTVKFNQVYPPYIKRDYQNPYDWQFMPMNRLFGEIKRVVELMPEETYNHAIWSALYMVDLMALHSLPDKMNRFLIVASFLHELVGMDAILSGTIALGSDQVSLRDLLHDFGIDSECKYIFYFFIYSVNFVADSWPAKKDFFQKIIGIFELYGLKFTKHEKDVKYSLITGIVLFNEAHLLGRTVYNSPDYKEKRVQALRRLAFTPQQDINARLDGYPFLSNRSASKVPLQSPQDYSPYIQQLKQEIIRLKNIK